MTDLQLFQNERFGQLRGHLDKNGNPWFIASDVCMALDLSDTSKTVSYLDDDEKGTISNRTPGGPQEMLIINEPGLYSLILRSRKPEAKAFKRWICHEVIPSIRQTGEYQTAKPRLISDEITARSAAVSYRMMARMKAYPESMRAVFAAKSVHLLTGEPLTTLLPPVQDSRESWLTPTDIGKNLGVNRNVVGRALKAVGLHGEEDPDHQWSQPVWNKSPHSEKQVVSFIYNPSIVLPRLEEYLTSPSSVSS